MIVLQTKGTSCWGDFSLLTGEAILLFAPPPKKGKVEFVKNNKKMFYCPQNPVWVKCVTYKTNKKDIFLINENLDIFKRKGVFVSSKSNISQKDIDVLDGGDMRLMNIILCRLKEEKFLEVNLAGLADDSVERVLEYVAEDVSCNHVAYVIVEYTDIDIVCENPMKISRDNIGQIMKILHVIWDKEKEKIVPKGYWKMMLKNMKNVWLKK